MIGPAPNFLTSPYFVDDEDNWHIKRGAPEEIVKEMTEWRKAHYGDEDIYGEKSVKKSLTDQIKELLDPLKR